MSDQTTDLVAKLRSCPIEDREARGGALMDEAADEIERLEGERDRLDKKCSALAFLLYGGWQPIETKPPNQRVLLWFPQLGYPVTGDSEVYSYAIGGWKATHWRPAPPGPSSAPDVPARTCVCGEPNALGVQHRTDGPCISIPRT